MTWSWLQLQLQLQMRKMWDPLPSTTIIIIILSSICAHYQTHTKTQTANAIPIPKAQSNPLRSRVSPFLGYPHSHLFHKPWTNDLPSKKFRMDPTCRRPGHPFAGQPPTRNHGASQANATHIVAQAFCLSLQRIHSLCCIRKQASNLRFRFLAL